MKIEKCKNCEHYYAYYRQRPTTYEKLHHGFCLKHKKSQTQNETCGEYNDNGQKETITASIRLEILDRAMKEMITISQILQEKQND